MSLATRCVNCGTVFRVVQDQLKVSEGWVRCGQCSEIFNGLETLFDLERDVPPEWTPPQRPEDDTPSRLGGPVDFELPVDEADLAPSHEHVDVPIGVAPPAAPATAPAMAPSPAPIEAAPESPAMAPAAETFGEVDSTPRAAQEPAFAPHDEGTSPSRYDISLDAPEPFTPDPEFFPTVPEPPPAIDPVAEPVFEAVATPVEEVHRESNFGIVHDLPDPAASIAPPAYDPGLDSLDHIDVSPVTHAETAAESPAQRVDERDRLDFPDARFDSTAGDSTGEVVDEIVRPVHDTTLSADEPGTALVAPEFVLDARRRARWTRPAARIALGVASLLLAALLLLQVGHQFRDTIAARWPATAPLLASGCAALGCTLQAPRHIDDIAVESTSLTHADGDAFKLSVTLRNRGTYALALPALDLSLTDATGQLVARKVLAPQDWQLKAATLPAGNELPLQMLLATDHARVTGYTVEVFYP